MLQSPAAVTFLANTDHLGYAPYIPAVVVKESSKHHHEKLRSTVDRFRSLASDLRYLKSYGEPAEQSVDDLMRTFEDYADFLLARVKSSGGAGLPDPNFSLDDISTRAVAGRKPFRGRKHGDKGFRDTLIWLSAIELAMSGNKVALLVLDKEDFWLNGETMAGDLKHDLESFGLDDDSVVLVKGFEEFNEIRVKPMLALAEEVKRRLDQDGYPEFKLSEAVNAEVIDQFQVHNYEYPQGSFGLPGQLESPTIAGIYDPENFKLVDVRVLDQSRYLVSVSYATEVDVDSYMYKPDAYSLGPGSNFGVSDWAWNDHYATVSGTAEARVECELIFDEVSVAIESLSIISIEPISPY